MAINKKLIHFRRKEVFEEKLANNEILNTSIVFIDDTNEIWTHGENYKFIEWDVLIPKGYDSLFIQDINGKLWTISDWDNSVTPNGIAIKVNDGYSVMALDTLSGSYQISSDKKFEAPDMPIFSTAAAAIQDVDGFSNTQLMASLYGDSTDYAVGTSMNYTFPNGENGYLPSAGELNIVLDNLDYAEQLLALCNGMSLSDGAFITSTRGVDFSNGQVSYWFWTKSNGWINWAGIDGMFTVRPFYKLNVENN